MSIFYPFAFSQRRLQKKQIKRILAVAGLIHINPSLVGATRRCLDVPGRLGGELGDFRSGSSLRMCQAEQQVNQEKMLQSRAAGGG